MRILLDNNVDHRFGHLLAGHEVVHARKMGWSALQNGELIAAGEAEKFDALITSDKNLRYQQNLAGRKIGIITLNSLFVTLQDIAPLAPQVIVALDNLAEGAFVTVG